MSSGPALGGDRPSDVRNVKGAFTGWSHLQYALNKGLPRSVKLAKQQARSIQRRRV